MADEKRAADTAASNAAAAGAAAPPAPPLLDAADPPAAPQTNQQHQQQPPPSRRRRRTLTIVHFNDVYNIEPPAHGAPGGAARFVAAARRAAEAEDALVLFSGDAYSPSLMSATVTLGRQMPPILNAAGVAAACVGNHDLGETRLG